MAPQAAGTGDADTSASVRSSRADKPMMIYITDDDATSKLTRKLEDVVFVNEQLGIGTKFFDTIKVSAGNALQDRMLKEAGRGTPRIIFMTRDYKVMKVHSKSRLSAGKLLKSMKLLARKEYKNSFEKMVRGYTKLLNDLDRLESKKALLADKRGRLQAKPSPSKEKKLARQEKKYQKDMDAWREREQKVLEFKARKSKKTEA